MAFSIIKYQGDGANNSFSIPFPYLDATHLKVYIDGELTVQYTLQGTNTLVTDQPLLNGSILTIKRETPKYSLVDFQDGSSLHKETLNRSALQTIYLVQEMVDLVESVPVLDEEDKFDMRGKVLKNVGDPTEPTDGATKGYLDDLKNLLITLEASTKQYAQQAADDATAAASSMTAASSSADNASRHAIEAITANVEAQEAAAEAIAKVDGIGDAVERSETAAVDAFISASNASASASQAQASYEASLIARNDAQAAADTATSKATEAETSEANALSYYLGAEEAKDEANTANIEAQTAATTATSKATEAENSAANASNSATVAGQAAQVASDAASLAATYVNFISGGDASGTNTNP